MPWSYWCGGNGDVGDVTGDVGFDGGPDGSRGFALVMRIGGPCAIVDAYVDVHRGGG